MADISKMTINNVTYDIKDPTARSDIASLSGSLGGLAYQSTATGSINVLDVNVNGETLNFTTVTQSISVS